jgi:hypothetical protein
MNFVASKREGEKVTYTINAQSNFIRFDVTAPVIKGAILAGMGRSQ